MGDSGGQIGLVSGRRGFECAIPSVVAVHPNLEGALRTAARLSVFAVRARYPDGEQVCLSEDELAATIEAADVVVRGAAGIVLGNTQG